MENLLFLGVPILKHIRVSIYELYSDNNIKPYINYINLASFLKVTCKGVIILIIDIIG